MATMGNVLITGCSTGIGRATALFLDQAGWHVFAAVRRKKDMAGLGEGSSERLTPILLDVSDPASISSAEAQIRQAIGQDGLAGLVNNAGVAFLSPLEAAPVEWVRRLFDVNVFGMLATTQTFLPLLRQGQGKVLNISSQAALMAVPFHGPYTASKVALNSLSHTLRRELSPLGVQVSMVIVGSVDTPIWTKQPEAAFPAAQRAAPEVDQLYAERFGKLCKFMDAVGRGGIAPEAVARTVAEALGAKRVRHCYYVGVGPSVRIFQVLKALTPVTYQDWIINRALGLDGNRSGRSPIGPQPQ